ncbi:MAG: CHAT domain-containing protein [Bryobacteraceae bacterium]
MSRDCGDHSGNAFALQNVFSGLVSSGRAAEGLVCARRLLAVGQEIGDPLIIGHALTNIAWVHWQIGDHVAAFHAAKEALRFAAGLGAKPSLHSFTGPEDIKKAATDLLLTLKQSRGDLRRAAADREAMLQIYRERGDVLQVVSSMESLANVHKELGDNEEALKWFSVALQEIERAELPDARIRQVTRAGLLGNMGVVLTNLGDIDEALRRIQESSLILSQLADTFGQIAVHGQRGRALLRAGRVRESLDSFEMMLQLAREHEAQAWQQAAHFNLTRAYVASGNRFEATAHCERAIALATEKLGHIGVDLYWLRAALFHPGASAQSDTAADAGRFIALAAYALAALHQEVRGSKPSTIIERWIDEFEAVIHSAFLLPPTEPLGIGSMQHTAGEMVPGRASLDSLDALARNSPFSGWLPLDIGLYCLESFRAQEFQERLLLDAAELELTHDPHLAAELSGVEAELQKLQSAPPIVVSGTASFDENSRLVMRESASQESIAEQERTQEDYRKRVAELSAARDALALKTIHSDDLQSVPVQKPARLSDLREALSENEMFLEFVLLGQSDQGKRAASDVVLLPPGTHPDGAYAIAVTESWMDVVPLGPTVAIEALCRKLLDMIERFGSALSLPFFQAEARRAFDLLLRPIWSRAGVAMETVRHLVIATDGVLNLLPLDLLVDEMREARSWRDFDYLIRRFSTEYTPSATVFVDLRQGRYRRGQPGGTFVGVGDPAYSSAERPPLPGTRREIATIAALVGGFKRAPSAEPVVLLDVNARKDRLSDPQLLKEAEYIHLACHGTAGKHPYSDGALFFAESERGDRRDSVLTTRHVMDLRTSAKLVVMSACESGLGKLTRGEGIQGLVRAWLFAGARSVIASMWEVDDDPAAEFMESVYPPLLDSAMTTADALAAAKRSAIEDERLACPVFWAAFVVFGGGSAGAPRERAATHGELFVIPDRLPHVTADAAAIGRHEREILGECGRAWEAAWRTASQGEFQAFFEASGKLVASVNASIDIANESPTTVALRLVAKNCRIGWEHWTKEHRAPLAVRAYEAYTKWQPSARSADWDALVSAYRPQNLQRVRDLARRNLLPREFGLQIDDSLHVSVATTVAWVEKDLDLSKPRNEPLEIALPIDDPGFVSTQAHHYCGSLGWAVFSLRPGESVCVTEEAPGSVHALEDDSLIFGGTWGSSLFPYVLTIRLHPIFVPLRLQREPLGRAHSLATVQFSPEGASIFLRPVRDPWLERIAVLFRRVPGANALFGAAGSPFLEEMEFGHFETLLQEVRRR